MSWIGKYLSEGGERSSLRLNMFLITCAIATVILASSFNIVWVTIHGKDPSWVSIATLITAVAAFCYTIWYGKKINKEQEGAAKPSKQSATNTP